MRRDLRIIYSLAFISVVCWIVYMGVHVTLDTQTYIDAVKKSLSNGMIDQWRLPVYPLLLGSVKLIFGDGFLWAVIILQNLVFLLTIRYFYKLLLWITGSNRLTFWLTLYYAFSPGIVCYNNYVVTESLAISFSVFLAWGLKTMLSENAWRGVVIVTVFIGLTVFMRPAQIYLLPVFLAIFGGMAFVQRYRRAALYGLGGVLFVTISFLAYMGVFKSNYGIYSPSAIGTVNQFYIGRYYDLIRKDDLQHHEIGAYLSDSQDDKNNSVLFIEAYSAIRNVGLKEAHDEIIYAMRRDPGGWVKAAWDRFCRSGYDRLFAIGPSKYYLIPFSVKMSSVYCFVAAFLLSLCYWVAKNKKIPWFIATLSLLVLANLKVSILGAQSEWWRLAFPSVPFLILMAGQAVSFVTRINKVNNG